ncbi:cyclase [Floricoccus tropicus]|uniref:Cyclase n=1 Tax=Floricoccus tropicus TaxID=1859473 RepID=A0A1E8GLP5_9LACT|nr:cyclase family protein [Floricoccus tropicus]OFI48563.1 cyclase [Floricoccus tropicus]
MSQILDSIKILKDKKWIDLTHDVTDSIPYFAAFSPLKETTLFTVENDGFLAKEYTIVSQYGTHLDAPVHFAEGKRSLQDIALDELVLPLYVIHKEDEVKQNSDYLLTVQDILDFEAEFEKIEAGSFVAFSSGWSKKWREKEAFYNIDENGQAHTPGWSLEALKFLDRERGVHAIGHETLDTDRAIDVTENKDIVGERYWLSQDKYQVEVLTNLEQIPSAGSAILLGLPKFKDAPGFGVRAFAITEYSHLKID